MSNVTENLNFHFVHLLFIACTFYSSANMLSVMFKNLKKKLVQHKQNIKYSNSEYEKLNNATDDTMFCIHI